MKFAKTGALAAVAVAVLGLTACQSNVGAAANIDGHRISESEVAGYLTPQSAPYAGQNGQVVPRSLVLQTLIRERLLTRGIEANGGPATPEELAAAKSTVLGGTSESDLTQQITKVGYDASFEPVYVRTNELLSVFGSRIKASSDADFIAALDKLQPSVDVSARYGTWDKKTLALGTTKVPDFLRLDSQSPVAAG